jgi:ADP-ribose pyrophosphatase YjhB (NUDIX family)
MTQVLFGDRIGKDARIRFGCSAAIFDSQRKKILLTRRSDNGLWCLPGGALIPGESVAEACVREVVEETGLEVRILRLIGVYSDPNRIVEYSDGHRCQIVALNFEAEVTGGELKITPETQAYGYYSLAEFQKMDNVMSNHRDRILDAFMDGAEPYIR